MQQPGQDLEQLGRERLAPLLDDCLDQVGQRLITLADRASSNAEQNTCFEVLGEIRHRRGGLVNDFFRQWQTLAGAGLPPEDAEEGLDPADVAQSRELVLCAEAILASHPRSSALPDALQPDLVCDAMIEAMKRQALHMDGRVFLLREFSHSVLDSLLELKPVSQQPVIWDRGRLELGLSDRVAGSDRRYAAWLNASGAGAQAGTATLSQFELCSLVCRTLGAGLQHAEAGAATELLMNSLRSEASRDYQGRVIYPAEQRMVFHVLCVYEHFLRDPDFADSAREMLAGLRVPALFAVLNEPELLGQSQHSVCQLLNELADTLLGWNGLPELETTGAWRWIAKLVSRIGGSMPGDLPAFLDGLIDWRLYRARRHARLRRMGYGMHMSHVQRAASDEQRTETQAELVELLRGRTLPAAVVPLFTEVWSDVLFLRRMHGEDAWCSEEELKQLLLDLFESMQPDLPVDRRHTVMRRLPALLKSLRGTLKAAGVSGEVQGAAIEAVEQVHSALLFGSIPLSSIEWVEMDAARLEALGAQHAETVAQPQADPALKARIPADVWLEFSEPWRDTARFKVYSVESDPQLAIVVNGTSLLVREISWTELDQAIAQGTVRALEAAPRFERALQLG